jgi:hypothetical protein
VALIAQAAQTGKSSRDAKPRRLNFPPLPIG